MATSFLDRLLGRTEPESVVEAKAVTGPGAFSMMYGTPLHSLSRDPHRLMAEAQTLFRANVWVHAAESAICNRLVGVPWHLEDGEGDTIDASSPEPYQAVLRLLERPSKGKTYKSLVKLTARHLGLTGNAFWYLDQRDQLAGTPLEIRYINPARMTPAINAAGDVTGWVLDHPENAVLNRMGADSQRRGVPFSADEIIHFTLDEPDWGVWGIGIAEAAQRKIELDRLTDVHTGGVLSSGGRLSGLVSPKTGTTVQDDQWVQFVRDWRSITSDPDAAKRLQIAKMPLDFTQMTANPRDLQLIDVARANKEDIFAGWQTPLSQIGVITSRGLNSGEAQGFDEATMMQGAVQPRGDAILEKAQIHLLDRFADLGVTVSLVIDWPQFDDESPLYENASKAKTIPLTVDQRLAQVGKDPLDEKIYGKLGQAIFIDQTMVPLFDPTAIAAPPPPVPEETPIPVSTPEETEVIEGKARDVRKPLLGLRSRTETTWEPKIRQALTEVLAEQRRWIISRAGHIAAKPKDGSWWNAGREDRRILAALEPLLRDMAEEVATNVKRTVKPAEGKADGFIDKVLELVRSSVGARISGINSTTRDKVQAIIGQGVDAGWGPAEIGKALREATAFDEARAELISRTETMNVYNDAALTSYRELGTEQVQAIDGDDDAECAARNGMTVSIDEARGITDHPNGTLDWIPVAKAAPDRTELLLEQIAAKDYTPIVNITTPPVEVHIPTPATPVVNVDTEVFVNEIRSLKASLTEKPQPRKLVVLRDADGRITGATEQ